MGTTKKVLSVIDFKRTSLPKTWPRFGLIAAVGQIYKMCPKKDADVAQ